jgi:hypothetical protein
MREGDVPIGPPDAEAWAGNKSARRLLLSQQKMALNSQ